MLDPLEKIFEGAEPLAGLRNAPGGPMELSALIVASFARNNQLSTTDLVPLLSSIHDCLRRLSIQTATPIATDWRLPEPTPERQSPAVDIARSVTSQAVYCLECGKPVKSLRRHLKMSHNPLSLERYVIKWDLPKTYPLVAPDYSKVRSAIALKGGFRSK